MRYAVLALGVCGVASAALLARIGLAAGLSAAELSAWRLTLGSAAFIGYLAWRRKLGWMRREDALKLAVAGAFLALHFATWIASLEYVSVARSTLLVATSPLWAGLAGLVVPALRPARSFWIGLVIALIGTLLVTSEVAAGAHKSPAWLGDVLALIGAVCIVPYLVLSQDVQQRMGTVRTVTGMYAFAALVLWIWLLPQHPQAPRSGAAWLAVGGMAVFAQLIGHSSLNWSLQHFSAAQVATATLLEPVFAALLAWVFLSERLGGMQALGGAVLLVGVWFCLRSEPKPATPEL